MRIAGPSQPASIACRTRTGRRAPVRPHQGTPPTACQAGLRDWHPAAAQPTHHRRQPGYAQAVTAVADRGVAECRAEARWVDPDAPPGCGCGAGVVGTPVGVSCDVRGCVGPGVWFTIRCVALCRGRGTVEAARQRFQPGFQQADAVPKLDDERQQRPKTASARTATIAQFPMSNRSSMGKIIKLSHLCDHSGILRKHCGAQGRSPGTARAVRTLSKRRIAAGDLFHPALRFKPRQENRMSKYRKRPCRSSASGSSSRWRPGNRSWCSQEGIDIAEFASIDLFRRPDGRQFWTIMPCPISTLPGAIALV